MKKVFKNLFCLSLGLIFVLNGCSKDGDDSGIGDVTGSYPVAVFVNIGNDYSYSDPVNATLTVSKDGGNLKISGNFTYDGLGKVNLNLIASSLKVSNGTEDGIKYSGFDYLIATQSVTVGSNDNSDFKGTGDFDDYDGGVSIYTEDGESFKELFFTISGDVAGVGSVKISVEPDYEMNGI